jgi:hypothetical protein
MLVNPGSRGFKRDALERGTKKRIDSSIIRKGGTEG